MKKNQVGWRNL